MQVELDLEKNSMSAQEEMMHSLIHNIAMEYSQFKEKNGLQNKKKKKAGQDDASFLDKRVN